MPRKSPKSTAENEADWYASPEGRAAGIRAFKRALKDGTLAVVEAGQYTSTDPALLQELLQRAKEKATKSISMRLPVADIEKAQSIAGKRGIGYQTLLKELIAKGLRKAG
jgi:hypothetical protein